MAELTSQPTSIQSIYAQFSEGKLFVNRRYQRKLVWRLDEKQKLIDSILKKYPIPAILIAEREQFPGTYEVIDGLQRLHAIVSFIEMSFSIEDGRCFNLEFFPTAKSRASEGKFTANEATEALTQREVSTILDYNLAISVMRGATETEINDVFDRINTYGHRLSDQERRQAGVENAFSNMVRKIACTLRGDESVDVLPLNLMPSISIDLPMTRHGYQIQANEVFWVSHGILRATDLRDSMDEQCIADISACIVSGRLIDRSKDALDAIYDDLASESEHINSALNAYGAEKFAAEFKFCVDEIIKICIQDKNEKLRDIVFERKTNNAFPSIFAVILIAIHELIIVDNNTICDYHGVKAAIKGLSNRLQRNRRATSPNERRRNIDTVKGLMQKYVLPSKSTKNIYDNHTIHDIDATIIRSEIELSNYELKQGILTLHNDRKQDENIINKIINTICAIANNGPERLGKIIIGITDKPEDTSRIESIDRITPRVIGKKHVVGVLREAKHLNISTVEYIDILRNGIKESKLSQPLKNSVLSSIDFHEYYGLGIIVISIQPQSAISFVNDEVYWRSADGTTKATKATEIASITQRFK